MGKRMKSNSSGSGGKQPAAMRGNRKQKDTLSSASIKAINTLSDVEMDSADEFHASRDQVMLNGRQDNDESDIEPHETVMGIDLSESEDDEDEHDDGEDDDAMVENEKAWGSRKSAYYDADDVDDEENAREEEEEALRIQRAQVEAMAEEDFIDEFAGSLSSLSAKGARPGVQLGQATEDDLLVQQVNDDLDRIDLKSKARSAWTVPDNATPEVLAKLVKKHAPELLELLPEFEEHFLDAVENTLPVLKKARQQGIDAADSTVFSYIETKYQVVMTYLCNIAFYLALKADNLTGAQDHPVLDVLVQARTALEQLEQLGEAGMDALVDEFDAMLDDLAEEARSVAKEQEPQSGLKAARKQKKSKKSKKKAIPSGDLQQQYAQMLALEDGDMDDWIDDTDLTLDPEPENEEKQTTYTPITAKKVSRKRKKAVNDYGDLEGLDEDDIDDKQISQRKNLRQYAVRVEQVAAKQGNRRATASGDMDLPYKDKHAAFLAQQQRDDARRARAVAQQAASDEDEAAGGASGSDDGNIHPAYLAAQQRVDAKRASKAAAKQARLSADPNWVNPDVVADEEGKRTIGYQILKNKGLAPKRTKEQRNPRVKHRKKFVKAQKKLKSVKAVASGASGPYAGEMTGIKSGVSRSVRFQ